MTLKRSETPVRHVTCLRDAVGKSGVMMGGLEHDRMSRGMVLAALLADESGGFPGAANYLFHSERQARPDHRRG